jgi:hypothetical protein
MRENHIEEKESKGKPFGDVVSELDKLRDCARRRCAVYVSSTLRAATRTRICTRTMLFIARTEVVARPIGLRPVIEKITVSLLIWLFG